MQKLFGLLDNEALSAIASMVISPMSFSILVSIVRHVTYEEIFAWERVERIREQGLGIVVFTEPFPSGNSTSIVFLCTLPTPFSHSLPKIPR